jgi:hypothetical protein
LTIEKEGLTHTRMWPAYTGRLPIRGWVDSRFLVIPIEAECPDPYDPAWKEGKP